MEKITSTQNPLVKKLVRLAEKQNFRTREGLTILEGVHLCGEYLLRVGAPEICVVVENSKSAEVAEIIKKTLKKQIKTVEVPRSVFAKISPVVDGVGLIFIVKMPQNLKEISPDKNTLILEDIQDPGNLGTILRSAVAFGIEQIICSGGTVSAWSPKVLRSGMGAHFGVEIFENRDLAEEISRLNIPIFATSLDAEKSIFEEDLSQKCAWIFGNEGRGVSADIQNLSTKKVIIPQSSKIESLNVAMATTVCLSESWRQKISKKL